MRSTRYLGTIPARYLLAGKQVAPSQPIPLGRFLMQKPPALAACLEPHQAPLIGAGMEGDAPLKGLLQRRLDQAKPSGQGDPRPE